MRHMMPKEILDAVDLQPKYRTFSGDSGLHFAAGAELTKIGTVTPSVSTNTNIPTATEVSAPVPMDVSLMSSNVSKTETLEQENDSDQYEQDQEYDGDELFSQGPGQRWF